LTKRDPTWDNVREGFYVKSKGKNGLITPKQVTQGGKKKKKCGVLRQVYAFFRV